MSDYTFTTKDPEIQARTIELFEEYDNLPNIATLNRLVAKGIDVHARSQRGYTQLYMAARNGHMATCTILIERGADINARSSIGCPLLYAAAIHNEDATVKALLAYGANVWAGDDDRLQTYINTWQPKLEAVKDGKFDPINTSQDLYYLASVMKPKNPKDIPHPKEFIRILFQQYLPHEPKFDRMYEEIFSQQRVKPLDLQSARKEAAKGRGVVL